MQRQSDLLQIILTLCPTRCFTSLLNSRQQAAALAQVTEAMKSLATGSAQMAAGTEQTKQGVKKLNGVALALQAMV